MKDNPLKIAFLAAAASPNTASWVQGMKERGHQVKVLTFHPAPLEGVDVTALPAPSLPFKLGYLLAVPSLRRHLQACSPDLVIGYQVLSYGLIGALAWNGPLVLTPAGSEILRPYSRRFPYERINRYMAARGDLFLAWSSHLAERLQELGASGDRITVLHRGIDSAVFRPDGPCPSYPRRPNFVSTRRFKPVYDHPTALRAVAALGAGSPADYWLLGDGPLGGRLNELAASLGIADRVHFPGPQAPETVARYLRGAEIYLSTSLSDGASSSLFEAMACGSFPVVSDIPANREWIQPGHNGFLVPCGDYRAFAEALRQALDNHDLRSKAVRANQELVRARLDRSNNLAVMEKLFYRLAGSPSNGSSGPHAIERS